MGTSCAPSYANLYLGGWERTVFAEETLQPFLNHVLCWYRFIDDLFVIWTRTESSQIQFIDQLNINQLKLCFTFSYDSSNIPFLDLKIIKGSTGQIRTDLYCKPTAGNTLLHASSAHPHPLVHSILYAQYFRLCRKCTKDGDFYIQASTLRDRLLARGYNQTNLRKTYNKALLLQNNL